MTELKSTTLPEQLAEIEFIKKARILSEKAEGIDIAMLNTMDMNGEYHGSPMYTFKIEDDGIIWMFASKDSTKVSNIQNVPSVVLNYSDPAKHLYITVNATASVFNDRQKIRDMWSSRYNEWFPYGAEDENLCLVKILPHSFEYWDSPDLLVSQLISLAKNALKGNPYVEGENEKLDM